VEERLVVDRELVLKEEIRVRRVRTTERYQEKVALRQQEAVVTREQADATTPGAKLTDPDETKSRR
jgi:stress response protein YsnF